MSSFPASPAALSRSYMYDVFLSFRGEDTRKTFVGHLYSALVDRQIHTYKDDKSLSPGEYIASSLYEAIEESRIAVIIFSQNYTNSSWCLHELEHIMNCRDQRGLIVIPIFYDVEPSEVKNLKRKFDEVSCDQEAMNTKNAESWRKTLSNASKISGWVLKNTANGNESEAIKKFVDKIWEMLLPTNSSVDEDLVGVEAKVKYLESQLEINANDVRMVGIWGIGGSGKTTLATSLYNKISHQFQGQCTIMENVREKLSKYNLEKLQENMLSNILSINEEMKVKSVEEGKWNHTKSQ